MLLPRINLYRSAKFTGLLLITHGLTCIGILFSGLPWFLCIGLVLIVLVSLVFYLKRDGWLTSASSVVALQALDMRYWRLMFFGGHEAIYVLMGDSIVNHFCLILHFKHVETQQSKYVVVLVDSIGLDEYHALIVFLIVNSDSLRQVD